MPRTRPATIEERRRAREQERLRAADRASWPQVPGSYEVGNERHIADCIAAGGFKSRKLERAR